MMKFYTPYTQDAARQTWSIEGVQIGKPDNLRCNWTPTHVEVFATEPLILKKGHNTITLPSLQIKEVVVFVDVAQELLDGCMNVKSRAIYSENTEAVRRQLNTGQK